MLQPGTPVVCIDAAFDILRCQCPPALVTPEEGQTYHVRDIMYTPGRGVGITLDEINNQHIAPDRPEANFSIQRFRLLAEVPALELEEIEYSHLEAI